MKRILIFLAVLFICLTSISTSKCENFIPTPLQNNSIFVSIASYRDTECPNTILNLYKNAKNPEKIFIGICQQNNSNDSDCLEELLKRNRHNIPIQNIRIMRLPYYDAMGPTYARYMASKLWNKETFYFQIDSHTQFIKNWDQICIDSVLHGERIIPKKKKTNGKVVLSYFPKANYNKEEKIPDNINDTLPYTCKSNLNAENIIRGGAYETDDFKKFPLVIPHVAGGMMFLRSDFLKDVPYDPWLTYVFEGEELLLSARLWTHGYTLIVPKSNVCFHLYNENKKLNDKGFEDRVLFWDDNKGSIVDNIKHGGKNRMKYLLGIVTLDKVPKEFKLNLDKYGMGKYRTLEEYYKFIGLDLKNKTAGDYCDSRYNLNTEKWEKKN